ncbi:cytochrome b/b6 domain-containing protein [Chamaesiphon sp. OTE_75_metabat_556]|uniref:cytochrome b n=1 Tax=Chamaesiphon sp. OTE_75_metabat_556 TaxID=2964692 RepID=UPI00286BB9BB|nr:cytochrome b/b6 domain-containing protein [Chamaesiphon sp. OTE_75_metabat_556]
MAIATKSRLNSAFKQLMSVHWWMAIADVVLFATGTFMSQLERGVSFRHSFYDFHKSMGVLSMALLTWRILLLLRVWWKKYTQRFPKFSWLWLKTLALHISLYVFMWAVPVSGFLLSNSFRANNVKFFGFVLPDIFPQDSAMENLGRNLHFWLSYSLLAFTLLHTIEQRKVVRANWRRFRQFLQSKLDRVRSGF